MEDRMEPLTHHLRHVSLVEEIRSRIDRVMEAIHRITTTKRHMQDGVTEMKCEIQSGVSSQLSAIRDREAWLLDQVDCQCQLKVDALTTQGDSLQQSLGQLHGLLQVSEGQLDDGDDHSGGVNSHIGDILESTKGDDLRPVTTPELRFKVDNAALLRAIHNYGCVDPDGLPFDSYVHPDWTSSSLPRAMEEYGDPSHNVLYKTVADVRQSQCNDNSIQVAVPRLHAAAGDWLHTDPCPKPCPQPTEHSAFCWNIPHSLSYLSDSTSSSSLHQWLLDIQNEADIDDSDGDFELIGYSTDQLGESDVSPKRDAAVQLPDSMTVFQEVIKSPSSSWLQNACPDETDPESCLCEDSGKEANPTREGDPKPATESMANWIQVATMSDVCRSHDASSCDARSAKEQPVVNVMYEATVDKWPLDRPLRNPSADLLYFQHFAVVLDSPSSHWLQHSDASPSMCRAELLKLQISDWLMLQSNHVKEVPLQS